MKKIFALQMPKKVQIDMLDRIEPDTFVQKAVGEPFDSKIIKHKEENLDPRINKLFNFTRCLELSQSAVQRS